MITEKELKFILQEGEGYKTEYNENYFYINFRQSEEYLKMAGRRKKDCLKGLVQIKVDIGSFRIMSSKFGVNAKCKR